MSKTRRASDRASFYARLYDSLVPDWPGEVAFYEGLARKLTAGGGPAVLEVACGTGRIGYRLARAGFDVVGIDRSAEMLEVARKKADGLHNARWVLGDMRTFNLGHRFRLAIVTGHAFQHMLTTADQVACLECIERHLSRDARLVVHVDHQNIAWLASLPRGTVPAFGKPVEVQDPSTGARIRVTRGWTCEPATQTAVVTVRHDFLGARGRLADRWEQGPVRLHCAFRFEMEHLFARAGLEVEAVHGDFMGGELNDKSTDMVWTLRKPRRAT